MELIKDNQVDIATFDFSIYRGDTHHIEILLDTVGDQEDINFEEVTFDMLVKPKYGSPIKPNLIVEGNILKIHFSHALTKDLTWDKALYDIQTTLDGNVKTILKGEIILIKDVTR